MIFDVLPEKKVDWGGQREGLRMFCKSTTIFIATRCCYGETPYRTR